ncbi:MAG: hypothetical protein A2504_14325 [Bdellovibrionales bacterium RIFOXYD12_FULL_39_22]|nr:MAG: hypothetical protein A2385_04760 [Bdellovibrionales bacterium RIFOXYB1_FULL_39_21]OFZ43459.1 MAG: hypothetical protein A2485_13275 [Bdellovibrionales bacterium RIFOXYC12_FULL_39_17]OFZ47002.1 MAG: hypothetical protein A2404_00335 [Bdellovibrionales bacterium RIFOXYC1_FULL_39_130]OFZ71366.1 MAG: hypothetical protein A2451_16300 [Bdellovibrionales bacterium RIFOXYC2_FULL_39_8]OFZ76199.1 MAG: hypothetical protein A2560_07585 [Bdellovibrionales bacterium RIFOXYD1_FULL_39_84]OFZ94434.1 MAG:
MSKLNAKILIVDDEEHIVNFLALTLEDSISEIIKAYNGREALELVAKHPDLVCILSDIKMPVMDGLELIREVRKTNKKIPFIFFSGFGSEKYMAEALKYGAYDFINKPDLENAEEVVLRAVNESLNGQAATGNLQNKLKDLF